MLIGYMRASTAGQSLELQRDALTLRTTARAA